MDSRARTPRQIPPDLLLWESIRPHSTTPAEHASALASLFERVAAVIGLALPRELLPPGSEHPRGNEFDPGAIAAAAADPARVLGAVHERYLAAQGGGGVSSRKKTGAFYTPAALIDRVLEAALLPALAEGARTPNVCDPSCGSGLFLVASARAIASATGLPLAHVIEHCVYGVDISPTAAAIARFSLWVHAQGGIAPALLHRNVVCADALLDDLPRGFALPATFPGFDAVIGNPPFLNQLETATANSRARAAALAERYGSISRAYADASAIFLELGMRLTRPGGRVAFVQPQSVIAARDAGPLRESVRRRGELVGLWASSERHFAASVHVCIPCVRVRTGDAGSHSEPLQPETWGHHLAAMHGIPEVNASLAHTLGDLADATADFRDQFYGLRGAVQEHSEADDSIPLITTALVDPARCAWGERDARIHGRAWSRPAADPARLDLAMQRWAKSRLIPKVLLASQTRVLECCVDEHGQWLPVVPLITITPKGPDQLWRIGAAVSSPLASAWAARTYAGTGLSPGAVKLSAQQCLRIPTPAPGPCWDSAADSFRAATKASDAKGRRTHLVAMAEAMCRASGLDDADTRTLMHWWLTRLPRRDASLAGAL